MCSSSINLFAQNTNSGDIRGTVTDSAGAVIPGVTVTVRDVDKGVVKTFTTNGAGLYDTGPIVPDHYLIDCTKEGFYHVRAWSQQLAANSWVFTGRSIDDLGIQST
jgi:hypothetical protein